jgi:hypothetical protein
MADELKAEVQFSRTNARGEEMAELRMLVPRSLLTSYDAFAMEAGDPNRSDYVLRLLAEHEAKRVHGASLLLRLHRSNPTMLERLGAKE